MTPHDQIIKMAVNKMGPIITDYYTVKFTKIQNGTKISWNWAAFFFVIAWMFYRRMYLFAFAALCLQIGWVSNSNYFLPSLINSGYSFVVFFGIGLIWMILFGMFGNIIYYRHLQHQERQGFAVLDEKPVDMFSFLFIIISPGVIEVLLLHLKLPQILWASLYFVPFIYYIPRYFYRRWKVKNSLHHLIKFFKISAILPQAAVTDHIQGFFGACDRYIQQVRVLPCP